MSDVEAQEQRLAEAVDANREALAALQAVTTAGSGGSSSSVADRVDGARRPAAAKGLGTSSDEEWGELQKMHAQIKEGAAETARATSERPCSALSSSPPRRTGSCPSILQLPPHRQVLWRLVIHLEPMLSPQRPQAQPYQGSTTPTT